MFKGDLAVTFEVNGRLARLVEPLIWLGEDGVTAAIPAGFESDGDTVPRLLWAILPPWGDPTTKAAILHDYLCAMIDNHTPVLGVEVRRKADRQFRLALRALNMSPFLAWACWAGVRSYSLLFAQYPIDKNLQPTT